MPIPNPVKAIGALAALGGGKIGAAALNKKIQQKNILAGKPQGALSEALFGRNPGRLNEGLAGQPTYTGTDADQVRKFQNYTPEQTALMNSLGQLGHTGIQNLINQQGEGFEPIAEHARRGFHQETVPTIAERFTNMASGANRSSAFGQQLGSAAANLESNLAALRANYGLQQQGLQQNLHTNLLGLGLKPQFENAFLGGNANDGPGGVLNNINPSYQDVLGLINSLGSGQNNNSTANTAAQVAGAAAGGALTGGAPALGKAAAAGGAGLTGAQAGLAAAGVMALSAIPFLAVKKLFGSKGFSPKPMKDSAGNVIKDEQGNPVYDLDPRDPNSKPKFWKSGERVRYDDSGSIIYPPKNAQDLKAFEQVEGLDARDKQREYEANARNAKDPLIKKFWQDAAQRIANDYESESDSESGSEEGSELGSEEEIVPDINSFAAREKLRDKTLAQMQAPEQNNPYLQQLDQILNVQSAIPTTVEQAQQIYDNPGMKKAIEILNNEENYTPEQVKMAYDVMQHPAAQKAGKLLGYIEEPVQNPQQEFDAADEQAIRGGLDKLSGNEGFVDRVKRLFGKAPKPEPENPLLPILHKIGAKPKVEPVAAPAPAPEPKKAAPKKKSAPKKKKSAPKKKNNRGK